MKLLKYLAIIFFDIIDKFYHQKRIIKFIKSNRLNLNIFLDIGSHLGTYSDLILKDFSNCKIYMFEPQIKIFKKIKIKYKNKKNVKIYNCAISDKNSFKNFYINQHDLTSSLAAMDLKNNTYYKLKSQLFGVTSSGMIVKKLKVKTLALNKILKLNKIKNVDLAKIDTEGHEYEVLKGLQSSIKNINYILIEFRNDKIYQSYDAKKIHNYLKKNNFVLKEIYKFPLTKWEDRFYSNNRFQ
jgi:FkbM family methyltransferase